MPNDSSNTNSGFIRTSRKNPCPICGETQYCSIAANGQFVICMKTKSDRPTQNGGHTHLLGGRGAKLGPKSTKNKIGWETQVSAGLQEPNPVPKSVHRGNVYKALLGTLRLNKAHESNLRERGLSTDYIEVCNFKSNGAFNIGQLSSELDLSGVPGFYKHNSVWKFALDRVDGFLVPYRDEHGVIDGMQIRCDDPGRSKYIWLSSKDKPFGSTSGSPTHFVNPGKCRTAKTVILTEGALKAGIIGFFTGEAVCGIAGINIPDDLPQRLTDLGIEKIRLAFDADHTTNDAVMLGLTRAASTLSVYGFEVNILTWDLSQGKGFDEFLACGHSQNEASEISFVKWRGIFNAPQVAVKDCHLERTKTVQPIANDGNSIGIRHDKDTSAHAYAETSALLSAFARQIGFSGKSCRFVETVIKAVGICRSWESVDDATSADTAQVSKKTIGEWRKIYKEESIKLDFSLIEIEEGDYEKNDQIYKTSKYRLSSLFIGTLNEAYAHLISIEGYDRNLRSRAWHISETTKLFISDLPQKGISRRKKEPKARRNDLLTELKRIKQRLGAITLSPKFENDSYNYQTEMLNEIAEIESEILSMRASIEALSENFTSWSEKTSYQIDENLYKCTMYAGEQTKEATHRVRDADEANDESHHSLREKTMPRRSGSKMLDFLIGDVPEPTPTGKVASSLKEGEATKPESGESTTDQRILRQPSQLEFPTARPPKAVDPKTEAFNGSSSQSTPSHLTEPQQNQPELQDGNDTTGQQNPFIQQKAERQSIREICQRDEEGEIRF